MPRILYLRSNAQSTFAAFIASGLEYSVNIQFEQFPEIPDNEWKGIEKVYNPEEALSHLKSHPVSSRTELHEKIESGYYDLVLLLDYEGRLFFYQEMTPIKKWRNTLGHFKKIFQLAPEKILQNVRLMQGLSLTLSEINKLVPVAIIDLDDWICLPQSGQKLLNNCSFYFKRELPFNLFHLYYQQRPAPWKRWRKKLVPSFAKVHNIPLGIEDKKYFDLKGRRRKEKEIDIFYCGEATSSPRVSVQKKLKELALTTSWEIVVADSLPFDDYCDKISRSKITISVSGGGWDCFRHYESVALGSIPYMDTPTVNAVWWRQLPKELFFSNTFDNFKHCLDKLLSDSFLRSSCLAQLEDAVESHMLHSRIVEHMITTALQETKNT